MYIYNAHTINIEKCVLTFTIYYMYYLVIYKFELKIANKDSLIDESS